MCMKLGNQLPFMLELYLGVLEIAIRTQFQIANTGDAGIVVA